MRVEVLNEGSRGFLGLGAKPARLKVSLKAPAAAAYAEAVLSRVLRAMGLPDKVKRKKDADGNNVLDVEGPSGGLLIGRHGQTLESLQYLVSKIVQRACDDERSLVIIDIESYRERQREKLNETALGMAKKAAETGQTVPLQPMSSRERRVVHLALRDHADVTTQSQGEGPRRRVMIVPKRPVAPAAPPPEGSMPEAVVLDPGNQTPAPQTAEPALADVEMVGNLVPPPPPDVDDNIGNRV
jgi:spoIIIJ-associated protein